MRSDDHRAVFEQRFVTEQIAQCRHALVIEAATRLVEDEDVWGCGKCHDKCEPTPFPVGEAPGCGVKELRDFEAVCQLFGACHLT
jgi:hypothetical protein